MPADLVMKAMNAVHRALIRVAPRRFGHEALGMPVLELTTTGRLSGRPRSVMLTSPVRDGDAIVVVASRGGDDRHPDWLLNLRAEPNVEVALRNGPRRPMTARVADAAERERLWKEITALQPRYAAYQRRTSREIPVVLLRPTGS
ncbi:MAG TPA: nitroreductase/quinone reductase family protein [Pseudonocardia sp.]|nr:nitroreductase/quinone reductase family protein [Pseudonocardia sp.]